MNISLKKAAKKAAKKVAITSIFLTGIASTFALQAHESTDSINRDSMNMDSASKEKTAMSMSMDMDMDNMKNMMGMMKMGSKEQMEDMMTACTRMMQMTSSHHSQKEGEAKK